MRVVIPMAWRAAALALTLVGQGAAPARAEAPLARLPALALDAAAVTVSGLSSGGYMAGQFQVAYSASLVGAAIVAGGPYGCSRGLVSTASLKCSCPGERSSLDELVDHVPGLGCEVLDPQVYLHISQRATHGNRSDIDATDHLRRHRIWLFSGGQDHVVDRRIVGVLPTYYQGLGVPEAQIRHVDLDDAGHGFPTPLATQACGASHTPFLTQCQVDGAGELLKWLYPALAGSQPGQAQPGALRRFRQGPYQDGAAFNGLDDTGWLYVPKACEQPGARCRLHVAFHGCQQGQGFVAGGKPFGTQFVEGAGYNAWAESGAIVVLYPQVRPSMQGSLYAPYRYNPKGCWDFWGYTERYAALHPNAPGFARRSAPQMKAVKAMIDDLLRAR